MGKIDMRKPGKQEARKVGEAAGEKKRGIQISRIIREMSLWSESLPVPLFRREGAMICRVIQCVTVIIPA
jgi:hypothetical protein